MLNCEEFIVTTSASEVTRKAGQIRGNTLSQGTIVKIYPDAFFRFVSSFNYHTGVLLATLFSFLNYRNACY